MFPFMKYRFLAMGISLTYIACFVGFFAYKYMTTGETFNYSIDFTGGTQVLFKLSTDVSAHEIKNILEQAGWPGAITREFSQQKEMLVRVKEYTNDSKGLAVRLQNALEQALPDTRVDILQNEAVGPGIGESLRMKSVWAVIISLLAMLVYIAVRFLSPSLALGAVIALFHDAICMLAFFFIFEREISLNVISAILAVLGYSINDTIVIFSQIRANYQKMDAQPLDYIIDVSINQTLRRTILTSFATALTVLSILLLAGEVLRDFALALLIGIVMGTYSSICIASPIFYLFHKRNN